MKNLSELHFDTLSEIINIGTKRAAQGLSEVIGESVQSSVPNVNLVKLENASIETLLLNAENFGVVTQEFTGALNAEVMLLFAQENVFRIVKNMMAMEVSIDVVREFESEAMCELGNIMINACLSSIADMLHIPIESSLPRYAVKSNHEIASYIKNTKHQDFVLASHVDLSIEQHPTEGKLFFLMNTASLDNVTDEIDRFTEEKML